MAGVAQGSADGPKKIFGRENVNWQGPQRANAASGEGDFTKSAGLDFGTRDSSKEAIEEAAFERGFDSGDDLSEALRQAYFDYSTHGGPGESILRDHLKEPILREYLSDSSIMFDYGHADEFRDSIDFDWNMFSTTEEGTEAIENALEQIEYSPSMIDVEADPNSDEGYVVHVDEDQKNEWMESDEVAILHSKFSDYVQKQQEDIYEDEEW